MSAYSYLWSKYSKQRLKEHPLCVYCRRRGRSVPARVTDHVKPHKGDPLLFWDPANHQSLCFNCHASEKQKEELGYVDRVKGGTVLCVASGPSLAVEDLEYARSRVHTTIAINTSYKAAPWAHMLYAADFNWWQSNIAAVRAARISAELWTVSLQAARAFKLNFIRAESGKQGLSRDASCIRTGLHSGYQVINLAYHLGARRIVLLGYDMQRTGGKSHWHGDHPRPCHNNMDFAAALERFPRLAIDLKSEGVEVVNCTRKTALTAFPRASIQEVLSDALGNARADQTAVQDSDVGHGARPGPDQQRKLRGILAGETLEPRERRRVGKPRRVRNKPAATASRPHRSAKDARRRPFQRRRAR